MRGGEEDVQVWGGMVGGFLGEGMGWLMGWRCGLKVVVVCDVGQDGK
jgi:hypothetical protein